MREEQRHAYDGKGEKGITPACAGRTGTDSGLYAGGRDHPRVCGKNKTTHNVIRVSRGSPPRVREELDGPRGILGNVRITPACAGRTLKERSDAEGAKDHPRVCGKNSANTARSPCFLGSPPRVREELWYYLPFIAVLGITPACAGRTRSFHSSLGTGQDHPRVCGKNYGGF